MNYYLCYTTCQRCHFIDLRKDFLAKTANDLFYL
jgi:hypothetical protein